MQVARAPTAPCPPAQPRARTARVSIPARVRVIEGVRLYGAAHDGKLPAKLADVTEPPLPDDPGTGRPFEYALDGNTATLVSQVPNDPRPHSGIRYRVTIRKN